MDVLYVLENERDKKFGRRLMDGLMAAAGKSGVYGTSRLDEEHKPVHGALERRGFSKVGKSYPSRDGKTNILLFVREQID